MREVPTTATSASDTSQQNRTLKVRIVFDSPDDRLRMGATGFAHIQVENLPIYNKVWRELRKLVALEKFGWGVIRNRVSWRAPVSRPPQETGFLVLGEKLWFN